MQHIRLGCFGRAQASHVRMMGAWESGAPRITPKLPRIVVLGGAKDDYGLLYWP